MKTTRSFASTLLFGALAAAHAHGPATTPHAATPPFAKRIYLANDDHTDYMWSTDADTYANIFVDQLDYNLQLAEETASNPPQFRNRFNTDGSFWLWNYERKKSAADFDHLMAKIKEGTISSPLNSLVLTYGSAPAEAILRSMYYAGRLERRYDLRFEIANATENQTLPLGLASLFAGSGAKYTWRGVCGCASHLPFKDVLNNRPNEVYWYTGHDGQRQLMKWYSLGKNNIGGYWEAGEKTSEEGLLALEKNEGFQRRHVDPVTKKPYDVIGLFGFGGDDLARKTGVTPPAPIPAVPRLQGVPSSPYSEHFHVIAERHTNDTRKVIVSNELDYFQDFSKHYGATLPSQSVTYGNEWDLYTASLAETLARAKRTTEKLRTSELISTLVSLKYPAFMGNHVGARDEAFTSLGLFWEHNWTADGPISRGHRAAWQEKMVTNVEYYVNATFAEGMVRLGGLIPRPENAKRVVVVNPLGWERTEFTDYRYTGPADIHVRDLSTGKDVPHQIVKNDGVRYLRFQATAVPSAGYKVFEILPGAGSAPTDVAAKVSGKGDSVIENAAVKLVVAPDGAVRSFIDKRRGNVELAATIDGLALNDFAANSDAGEPLRVENAGPVSVTLRARSDAGLPHTTTITLYRESDRVDIRNEITNNFSDVRHWTFSLNLAKPALRTEEVGGINLNKLASEGGDYANTHARYDYITVNHFADFTDGKNQRGITLSNPDLAFAKMGKSTVKVLDSTTPQLHMLAGGQIDGRALGIQDQNDATRFLQRFALRAHGGYDQVSAMKFALEHQNPLVSAEVLFDKKIPLTTPLPETQFSLVSTNNPNVLLWAVKPAEEGIDQGVVTRWWNLSNVPEQAQLNLAPGIVSAQRTTHIETNLESINVSSDGSVPTSFARQQLQTYRLKMPNPPVTR